MTTEITTLTALRKAPPRAWLVWLAALLGVTLTASLGLWQLGRAQLKEAIALQIQQRAELPALDNASLLKALSGTDELPASLHYRKAQLVGRWVSEHMIFLDNRQMNARVGFYVLTPFMLSGSERALLVQRGWVPRHFDHRQALPTIHTPEAEQQISLRLTPPPGRLYQFSADTAGVIRQNIDIAAYAAETKLKLLPLSAQQLAPDAGIAQDKADGLQRDWPAINAGSEKNYGYAVQWFALSALIAGLTLWFRVLRPRRMRASESERS